MDGAPALLTGGVARCWTVDGYADRSPGRPSGVVDVITPPSIVRTLVAGYEPRLHAGWG